MSGMGLGSPYPSPDDLLADLKEAVRSGLGSEGTRKTKLLDLRCVRRRSESPSVARRQQVLAVLLDEVLSTFSDSEMRFGRALLGLDGHLTEPFGTRRKRAASELRLSVETTRRKQEGDLLAELARELFLVEEDAVGAHEDLAGSAVGTGAEQLIPFRHVRNARRAVEDGSGIGASAEFTGLVVGEPRSFEAVVFATLDDDSGQIQVVAREDRLPASSWRQANELRSKDRVRVAGRIDKTNKGWLSVFADAFEVLSPINFSDLSGVSEKSPITTQVVLAMLRRNASDYFTKAKFEELEPTYITMTRKSQVEPLVVVYPGYGGEAHLTPSPFPQLRAAILRSGHEKFFCIGRCFSGMLRDGYTSAESLILCAAQLDATLLSMSRLAEEAVKAIFQFLETRPQLLEDDWLISDWSVSKATAPAAFRESLEAPEIQLFKLVEGKPARCAKRDEAQIFRVCWPPGAIVAEGHVELLEDESLQIGTVNLYLERLAAAVQELPALRLR